MFKKLKMTQTNSLFYLVNRSKLFLQRKAANCYIWEDLTSKRFELLLKKIGKTILQIIPNQLI